MAQIYTWREEMAFFFILIAVMLIIYLYPAARIIPSLSQPPYSLVLWLFCLFLLLLPFLHLFLRRKGGRPELIDNTGWLAYGVLGFMTLLVCLVFLRDLVLLLISLYQMVVAQSSAADPVRRELLVKGSNLALLFTGAAACSYGFIQARKDPAIVHRHVRIPGLHKDLTGLKILQISDIHVGPTIKGDFVARVVEKCKQVDADLIVLTGDLVDGSVGHLEADVRILEELQAPLGKYFVTGNHEYYSGVEQWLKLVSSLGFEVLLNEHRTLQKNGGVLTLAGVTDYSAGRIKKDHTSDPAAALRGCDPKSCKVLLAHQPKSVFQAAECGVDLQLSGHTHGGQYFPGNFLVKIDQPFVSGFYTHKDTQLYVSRGTGYWGPPLRLGVSSEITVLELV